MRRRRIELAVLLLVSAAIAASGAGGHAGPSGKAEADAGFLRMGIVTEALGWRGSPYRYGGRSKRGVDCSGFVNAVLRAAGVSGELPRKSSGFASFGEPVDGDLEPGDILLFGTEKGVNHVGIALSEDSFIHAMSEGSRTGVVISSLDDGTWQSRFLGARRIGEGTR